MALVLGVVGALVWRGRHSAPAPRAVQHSAAGETGPVARQAGPPTAPQPPPDDGRVAVLARQLALIEDELGLNPPMAWQSLQTLLTEARAAGLKAVVARAEALEERVGDALQTWVGAELDTRIGRIEALVAADQLLDALQLFGELRRHFGGQLAGPLAARVDALGKRLAGLEQAAIVALETAIDGSLARGDWEAVQDAIADLGGFGVRGAGLASRYERQLRTRKVAYLDARRAAGRTLVRRVGRARLEAVRAERRRRRALDARRLAECSAMARERTRLQAIPRIELRDGRVYERCRIEALEADGIRVSGALGDRIQTQVKLLWSLLKPTSRARVAPVTLPPDDSAGFAALGRYCIVNGLYDAADSAFSQACRMDPALATTLPEVDRYRAPQRFCAGQVELVAGVLRVRYAFDDADELVDFGRGGFALQVRDGELRFPAGLPLTPPTHGVRPPLALRLEVGRSPPGGLVMVQVLGQSAQGPRVVAIVLDASHDRYAVDDSSGSRRQALTKVLSGALELKVCRKSPRLALALDGTQLTVHIGDQQVYRGPMQARGARAMVVGISRNRAATFALAGLELRGRLTRGELQRVIDEKRASLLRDLQPDLAGGSADALELPTLPDEQTARLTPSELAVYRELLTALESYVGQPYAGGRPVVEQALERAATQIPRCAALHFWRGWYRALVGQTAEAEAALRRAIELDDGLVQAWLALARLLERQGRLAEARTTTRRCLAQQPDAGQALGLLARLDFYARATPADGRAAIEAMEVAVLLEPKNAALRRAASQLRHVLRGPPWPRGDPLTLESEHYTLVTDLPRAQAEAMRAQLETIRKAFVRFLPPQGQPVRKGQVFVYSTEATYEVFAELTMGEPAHNTLGYYHPGFRQLHLFKRTEDLIADDVALTMATLRHEAFHQYVHNLIPDIPRWVNEGLAELFGEAIAKGGSVRHGVATERMAQLRQARQWIRPLSVKALMGLGTIEFMRYPLGYPQAWSIVHLCLVEKAAAYRAPMMRYLALLRAGKPRFEAFAETLGRLDLDRMNAEWKAMTDRMIADLGRGG